MPIAPAPLEPPAAAARAAEQDCSTIEVARRLGLAVRSVQLMVDRGELQAWKTPGGHRRIARESVQQWLAHRQGGVGRVAAADQAPTQESAMPPLLPAPAPAVGAPQPAADSPPAAARVLLIEDSRHFQKLVALLVQQHFPAVELHVADDGIAGLALAGQLQPQVLLVDLLLPGIDGAALITGLRTHAAFEAMRLVVVTSLHGDELAPYAHALAGLPVVHKPRLVAELPGLLARALAQTQAHVAVASASTALVGSQAR